MTPGGNAMRGRMATARDEILEAAPAMVRPDGTFTLDAVPQELPSGGCRHAESTIRTHVTGRICADSAKNHAIPYAKPGAIPDGRLLRACLALRF